MIQIDYLKNHVGVIPRLVEIWHDGIGKTWLPDVPVTRVHDKLHTHLSDSSLPMTFVAFEDNIPVGMCSLRDNDGLINDLTPWLGGLVVDAAYQNKGIAKKLMTRVLDKARDLGFEKCFLFAFDPTIPEYYASFGWNTIGTDTFKDHPVTVMEFVL